MLQTSSGLFGVNTVGYIVGGYEAEGSAEGFGLLGEHLCSDMAGKEEGYVKELRGTNEHDLRLMLVRCLNMVMDMRMRSVAERYWR